MRTIVWPAQSRQRLEAGLADALRACLEAVIWPANRFGTSFRLFLLAQ